MSQAATPDLLLPRDRERLVGVHQDLVDVVLLARLHTPFIVLEGLRSAERQAKLVQIGASRTMNSRHITGHAVDLGYWLDDGDGKVGNGEVRWDWPLYHQQAAAMKAAAAQLGVKIIWGGDWKSFPDGPHFELDRRFYP
ncbi:MAG: M15 family metallopeptidase [Roseomonas sp.]|nr:M15 family metallopeptidase [Roseomonas sp.]